jgi:hypothetical protein
MAIPRISQWKVKALEPGDVTGFHLPSFAVFK